MAENRNNKGSNGEQKRGVRVKAKIRSENLFLGNSQLFIEHDNSEYCLRVTSNNKLILTK